MCAQELFPHHFHLCFIYCHLLQSRSRDNVALFGLFASLKKKTKTKSKCENIHLFPLILKLSLLMIINWSNTKTLHNKCAEHLLRTYRRLLETTNDVITRLE